MFKLTPENRRFRYLLDRIIPGLGNGFGGFQYQTIDSVFDTNGIGGGVRPVLHDRVLTYIRAMIAARKSNTDSPPKNAVTDAAGVMAALPVEVNNKKPGAN